MAAPPPFYGHGQGPPGNYAQQPVPPGVGYTWIRGPMGMFGKDPLTTICPNCQANVRNCI